MPELRRGDEVIVLSGKDAGKRGTIDRVIVDRIARAKVKGRGAPSAMWRRTSPRSDVTIVVGGLNMAKRHTKPRPRRDRGSQMPRVQAGGILDIAQPCSISKVMLICPLAGGRRASSTAARRRPEPCACAAMPTAPSRSRREVKA